MASTYFQDFTRDNGLPIIVEYSATGGEPNFDHPGHICDGGGSGPEIVILYAWPRTPGHQRLAKLGLSISRRIRVARLFEILLRLDAWWRASLTDAERERFELWIAENLVDEPDYESEFDYAP